MNSDARAEAEAWVLAWQKKLHRWAATNKEQRYRDVYNLTCDPRTLMLAWRHVKANKGSRTAGVDWLTRNEIKEGDGEERFLRRIREELRTGTYRPRPVREKAIPKASGKVRYLGIPTLRDRVVQQALRMVLEPIFEADFYASSYAYRPGRRAQDAIQEIDHFVRPQIGYSWVIEGDIRGCFDNVHHGILVEEVRRRVVDRKVIRLIQSFLRAGVITELGSYRRTVTGTPQGGILSPLLANIYLSRLDRFFSSKWGQYATANRRHRRRGRGLETCYMVRFADDFVVMVNGTREQAESLKQETAEFLKRDLRMELSWEKTHVTNIKEGINFLGHHLVLKPNQKGRLKDLWVRIYPSKKSLRNVQEKVKRITSRRMLNESLGQIIGQVNRILRGWCYYFRFDHSWRTFGYLEYYAWVRLYRWIRKKHRKVPWRLLRRKYCPDGTYRHEGQVFFRVKNIRKGTYAYRGHHIPTPWDEEAQALKRTRWGDRLPDEPRILEGLELNCAL